MIKHIVMWTFADEALGNAKAENVAEVARRLTRCAGIVDGMGAFQVATAQPGLEASFDLCLYSEFTSTDALAAYVAHPIHQDAAGLIRQVVTARVAFDYDEAGLA